MPKEENKENKLPPAIYNKLVENETELTSYLKYIRHRPQASKVPLSLPKHLMSQSRDPPKEKKMCCQVRTYVEDYLKLVREVNNL